MGGLASTEGRRWLSRMRRERRESSSIIRSASKAFERVWMAFYLPLEGDTRNTRNTGAAPPGNSHQLDRKYRNSCSQISVVNI